jgi:hypothetical protein
MYPDRMKRSTGITLLFALVTGIFTVSALAQTEAMPPEQNATTHQNKPMAGMEAAKTPVPPSRFLALSYQGKTINLTLTDLANMPATTVHVRNGHTNAEETYSGPLLSEVLAKIGLTSSAETHSLILHSAIIATGTDHYFVVYSGAEVEPTFATGQVIVAVMKSGLPDKDGGLIQLINTSDAKPARWVHGLSGISVMTVTQNQ